MKPRIRICAMSTCATVFFAGHQRQKYCSRCCGELAKTAQNRAALRRYRRKHAHSKNVFAQALARLRWAKEPQAGRAEAARKASRARWDRVKKSAAGTQ